MSQECSAELMVEQTATHPWLCLKSTVKLKSEYGTHLQVISVLSGTSHMPCLISASSIKLKRLFTIWFDYKLCVLAEDRECVPAEPKRPSYI
jgi:hypothetical protein